MAGIINDEAEELVLDMLCRRDLSDRDANLELGLYTNASVSAATTLAQITEPVGGGYARIDLIDANWPTSKPRTIDEPT